MAPKRFGGGNYIFGRAVPKYIICAVSARGVTPLLLLPDTAQTVQQNSTYISSGRDLTNSTIIINNRSWGALQHASSSSLQQYDEWNEYVSR